MIETIVVIAIVTSLCSILFSAIKSSKDIAIKATCMSNISQIRNHAELYRKDSNNLPYSEVWLTDFSWAQNYISESSLDVFNCPGDENATELTSYDMLQQNTSYFYVPSSVQLEKNLEDGQSFGIDSSLLAKLKASQDAVIYDRSPAHHNGSVNIAFLFKSDDPDFNGDGNTGTITSQNDPENSELLALLDDGTIELPDVEVADEPVADPVEETEEEPEPAATFTIVASAGTGGSISPSGSSTFDEGGSQTYVITPDVGSSTSSTKTKSNNGHGNNEDGVDSSNPGNSKKGEDYDPTVDDESKSNGSSSSSDSSSTASYAILDVLVNGVSVGAVSSYTFSDIDDDHTISATFIEIIEEEETTVAGKSNNGHGNNEDGVDSSNPGNSKSGEDSDPSVDDESKGGSSSSTEDESSSNGNGNSKNKNKNK